MTTTLTPYIRRPAPPNVSDVPDWLGVEFGNVQRALTLTLPGNRAAASFADYFAARDVYNVLDYGKRSTVYNTGATLATSILQNAADDADAAGGGVVVVPAGIYLASGVALGDNTWLVLSPHTTIRQDPSAPYPSVLISNKRISGTLPIAGNTNIRIIGGVLDGNYSGTVGITSTHVVLFSLCTFTYLQGVRIIAPRRNGATFEFCLSSGPDGQCSFDGAQVNNIYFSGSDHGFLGDGLVSRNGGLSGSGANFTLSASWFTTVGAVQLIRPAPGGYSLLVANDSEHFTFAGGLIEGVNTVNTALTAEPYYGAITGSDHFNRPVYDAVRYHSGAKGLFDGVTFRGMKGQNANAVNWTRGNDVTFGECVFEAAWGNGLATNGTNNVKVIGGVVRDCGDIAMGDGVTPVPAIGRYAVSFDYLDANYPGSGCVIDGLEMCDTGGQVGQTKVASTTQGILLGTTTTPAGVAIKRVTQRNLAGNPLTIATNVPVALDANDWGLTQLADNGDASVTLSLTSDSTQYWKTPFTGAHVVNPPPVGVAARMRFTLVRTAAATGAAALTVFGLKALAVGQAVTFEYDGAAWVEVAFTSAL